MRTFFSTLLALAVLAPAHAHAQTAAPSRGALLYNTHCIECHSTQMHWREQRLARDWHSLKAQVRRFQGVAGLAWNEEDIDAVARHLNDTIYRYPETQARR
jgi:mono/diheme cytochrome c family protein